jgi:tetratricopeptide (TPR) repeat protein
MRNSIANTYPLFTLSASNILIFLLFLPCHDVSSQNKKMDSLRSLLPGKSIHDRADILYDLAYNSAKINNEMSLEYGSQALEIARTSGDSLRIVKAGRIKSYIYRRLNEMDSSLILSSEILPIARRNKYVVELKSILNDLAYASIAKASYDKALKYLFESLELKKIDGNKFEISVALHNIGLVYYKLNDRDKALNYYQEALDLKNEIDNKYDLDILLVNIGLCYAYNKRFLEASNYIEEGLVKCGKNCSNLLLVEAFLGYGIIFFYEKEFSKAEQQFLKSYSLSKNGHEQFQLENTIWLSEIYIRNGQISRAEKYLNEAEAIIGKNSPFNFELIRIYAQLFKLYQKNQDFEKIALYQNKYISLKDSIFNEELTKNLMKAEVEYQEKENRARIESQNKILALNEEVMYRQKIGNASVGTIAVLVIILSVILAKNNKHKQLINKLLDERVKERTRELEMNRDALQRAWQERNALISKASSDIQSSIATLKGLCLLGAREIDHPKATEYWKQLDNTSNGLSAIMNKMQYSYKTNTPPE